MHKEQYDIKIYKQKLTKLQAIKNIRYCACRAFKTPALQMCPVMLSHQKLPSLYRAGTACPQT